MLSLSRPDNDRIWSLSNVVFVTYTTFLAGFYFVPNAVDHYKFYIAAVFFPSLLLLPAALKQARHSLIWLSLLAYLGYMLLSSLWSDNFSTAMLWRDTRYTGYILSFIVVTLYFFGRNRLLPTAIMQLVALVVIVAAAISIATFEPDTQQPASLRYRQVGLGITDNPNPSAFIYGFFAVIALDYARRHWGEKLAYVYGAGFAIIFLFVILTQSNTGLLALTAACTLLFLADRRRARPTLFIGLLLGLVTAAYLAWSLGLLAAAVDPGFNKRLAIWQYVVEQWQTAPVFGHGYQKVIVLAKNGTQSTVNYAHSAFLSTLRDGGLVGLLLLLLVYVFALRSALKMALAERNSLYLCLFMFGLVCVLVDVDQIVTRPRELWVILWLPLACLMAYELGLAGEKSPDTVDARTGASPKNCR
jgi:O-antigen ligase